LKPIFGASGVIRFARDLPKLITFEPPPCTWFMRKIQKPNRSTNGSRPVRIDHHGDEPTPFELKSTGECHRFIACSIANSDWSSRSGSVTCASLR
jgi:hypothetical protein